MSDEIEDLDPDFPARICGDLIQDLHNVGSIARFESSEKKGSNGFITLKNREEKTCTVTVERECLEDIENAGDSARHRKLAVMAKIMDELADSNRTEAIIRTTDLPNE